MQTKINTLSPRYHISLRKLLKNKVSRSVEQSEEHQMELSSYEEIESRFLYYQQQASKEWLVQGSLENLKPINSKKTIRSIIQQESPASMYFSKDNRIKKSQKDNLHKLVHQQGYQFLNTIFDALIIETLREQYGYENSFILDRMGTVQKILKTFEISVQILIDQNEDEKREYVKKRMIGTINGMLQDWDKRIIQKQQKLKINEKMLKKQIKNQNSDVLHWLQLKTKFQALKKKLRHLIVEKLNEYDNRLAAVKRRLENVTKMQTSEILKRSDPIIGKLLSSLKVLSSLNLNQLAQWDYKEGKRQKVKKIEESLENLEIWNDELELKFLKNRQQAKLKYDMNIASSNFNKMGFMPLVQELHLSDKKTIKRQELLDRYSDGSWLTYEELKFITDTSELLNACVDREAIQSIVNNLDQTQIQALETNISEEIIEQNDRISRLIRNARLKYLKQKNNNLYRSNKQTQFAQEKQKYIEKERVKLKKEKQQCIALIDKLLEKNGRLQTEYIAASNFFVRIFANEVKRRIKKIRKFKDISQKQENKVKRMRILTPQVRPLHPPSALAYYPPHREKNEFLQQSKKHQLRSNSPRQWTSHSFKIQKFSCNAELDQNLQKQEYNPKELRDFSNKEIELVVNIQRNYRRFKFRKLLKEKRKQRDLKLIQKYQKWLLAYYYRLNIRKIVSQIHKVNQDKLQRKQSEKKVVQTTNLFERYIKAPRIKVISPETKQEFSIKQKKLLQYSKSNQYQILLKSGFIFRKEDFLIKDQQGNTPLYYSILNKNLEMSQWMIENGSKVNEKCENGNTPFHIAFKKQNIDLIMLIQRNKGDLNIINKEGLTPIAYGSDRVIDWLALQDGVAMTNNKPPEKDNNELWFKKQRNLDPQYNSDLRIKQKIKNIEGNDALFVESY